MEDDKTNLVKPNRRWLQFNLKSLMALPLIVGSLLSLYLYWDEWRKYRPPHTKYNLNENEPIFWSFLDDLRVGRLDQAYLSTSPSFKRHVSGRHFEFLIQSHPLIHDWRDSQEVTWGGGKPNPQKNWTGHYITMKGPGKHATELWIWVVIDDSFFYRRPPPPSVGEIQFRDIDWPPPKTYQPLKPSWEQE